MLQTATHILRNVFNSLFYPTSISSSFSNISPFQFSICRGPVSGAGSLRAGHFPGDDRRHRGPTEPRQTRPGTHGAYRAPPRCMLDDPLRATAADGDCDTTRTHRHSLLHVTSRTQQQPTASATRPAPTGTACYM